MSVISVNQRRLALLFFLFSRRPHFLELLFLGRADLAQHPEIFCDLVVYARRLRNHQRARIGKRLLVPANAELGSVGSASYYGGADTLLASISPEQRREWRTPPLWGVRDSGPYLHDGRARTFSEAIAWHGGEAAQSARAFRRLTKDEQEEVIAFLNCLAAPAPESLALANTELGGGQ